MGTHCKAVRAAVAPFPLRLSACCLFASSEKKITGKLDKMTYLENDSSLILDGQIQYKRRETIKQCSKSSAKFEYICD